MKLKIPPVFVVLFFSFLMWFIFKLTQARHIKFEHQKLVSWSFFCVGVFIGVVAVYSFRKARTTVDPSRPNKASNLVTAGVYRYSRNPMYLGMLFILISFAIRIGNLYSFLVLPVYVWYITTYQIKPEEEVLTTLFQDQFMNYKKVVRRWI